MCSIMKEQKQNFHKKQKYFPAESIWWNSSHGHMGNFSIAQQKIAKVESKE